MESWTFPKAVIDEGTGMKGITAPAQLHATDVVMYTATPCPPPPLLAPNITTPAPPHATEVVVYTALLKWSFEQMYYK